MSPALAGRLFTSEQPGKPVSTVTYLQVNNPKVLHSLKFVPCMQAGNSELSSHFIPAVDCESSSILYCYLMIAYKHSTSLPRKNIVSYFVSKLNIYHLLYLPSAL